MGESTREERVAEALLSFPAAEQLFRSEKAITTENKEEAESNV
jgi:hypothetical protein